MDKQTNLHPKNDSGTNLKPNIISENIPDKAVTLEKLDQSIQDTISNHTASIADNTTLIDKIDIGGKKTAVGSFKNLLTFVYGSWWEWNADKIIVLHPNKQRLAMKQSIVFDQDIMLTASGNLDIAILYTDEQNKYLDKTYHVKNGSFIVPAGKRFLLSLMPISNPTDIDNIYDNDLYNSMGIYDISHFRSAVLYGNDYIDEFFLLDSVTGSEALCLSQVANRYQLNDTDAIKYYTKIAFSFVSDTAVEIFGLDSGIVTDENLIPALEVGKTYPISDLKTKKIVGYCILKKTPEIHNRKYPFENCTLSSHYLPLHENDDILLQLTQYPLIKYPYHNDSFLSIAHQGYWYGTKLNQTRQAYIEALKRGASCLECDLQFTSDGEIVLCHDETFFNPTTGETYHISQHTLQECQSQDFKVAGYRIMTLRELFTIAKTCGVHVEVDHFYAADSEAKFAKVISLIEEFSFWKMVIMNNASDWQRAKLPDYVALSYDDDKNGNDSRVSLLATHQVYIFFYSGLYDGTTVTVDKDYVLSVKKKGFKVGLWPINNLDDYAEYSQYFDSITSDRYYLPTVMAKILNEKTPFNRLYVKDDLD